jgi:transposase
VSQFSSQMETGSKLDGAGRGTQGAVGEQRFSSGGVLALPEGVADPELVERAKRRKFTAKYKLAIVAEADAVAGEPGGIGALLRREGLYSSHLGKWRGQRDAGALGALAPRQRGPQKQNADAVENAKLRRERDKAVADLETARRVIEVQGKVSALLEELLSTSATETDVGRSQR